MVRIIRKVARLFSAEQRNLRRYRRRCVSANVDFSNVLFEQQCGLTADGNLFYIARELDALVADSRLKIWFAADISHFEAIKHEFNIRGLNALIVERRSRQYYDLLSTAGLLVCDTSFPPEFCKRRDQMMLNTWHGTPLKTLGKQIPGEAHLIGNVQRCFMVADFLLMPNEFTRERLMRDYMFEHFFDGRLLYCGYPRNAELLGDGGKTVRVQYAPNARKVYAYMPTFRASEDGSKNGGVGEIARHIGEIDELLADDEVLFAQLHPVVREQLDFGGFKHVRPFPREIETYELLAACEVLITDYSSVMFDFSATGKKVVLFAFDEDQYLDSRGFYMELDELPFPRVRTAADAVTEARSPKSYDDTVILERFCKYDSPDATNSLCRRVFFGEQGTVHEAGVSKDADRALVLVEDSNAGKIDVLNCARQRACDLSKSHHVMFALPSRSIRDNQSLVNDLPDGVSFIGIPKKVMHTIPELIAKRVERFGICKRWSNKKRSENEGFEQRRLFGDLTFDVIERF